MSKPGSSLRKAAILISALDSAAADRLLDQMGEQQAARVRSAVVQLDDVDPAEQEAILAEFFGRTNPPQRRSSGSPSGDVELELSPTLAAPQTVYRTEPAERFRFLHDAPSDHLGKRLQEEHPQLIALVAAHLPAEKGAELLECLPQRLQEEVLDRLAELDDADPEIIADLERELERLFAGTLRRQEPRGKRLDHLQAIVGHLRRRSMARPTPVDTSSAGNDRPPKRPRREPEKGVAVEPERPIAFERLGELPEGDFFALFDQADPRIVMLALAGASRELFERYVSQFSSERAAEFERHLEQLRPLRLRDVEAAQQELAILAGRQVRSARAAAESSRRFAAAA
jgi:flagellar motor switch protein FliG